MQVSNSSPNFSVERLGREGAASMGVWGPVLSCRTWTRSLSALSRTVATGRVWPSSNGALCVRLVCQAWVT